MVAPAPIYAPQRATGGVARTELGCPVRRLHVRVRQRAPDSMGSGARISRESRMAMSVMDVGVVRVPVR
jgi:hypothetical protein